LQKDSLYAANTNATTLANSGSVGGWGSGSSSSIGHKGDGGITNLEHASVTFFLIQTTNSPNPGSDVDTNNDGVLDGNQVASWTVLDSVGVLGNNGAGDIGYGAINFRRNAAALASGTIVPVSFTPSYVGRSSNTVGSAASDWVASDILGGAAPNFTLGVSTNTQPTNYSGMALNHLGGPNFGAPAIPGVIVFQPDGSTGVSESGGTDSYTIGLNTSPSGTVTVQISADPQLQVSTDGGASFGSLKTLTFNSSAPKAVLVRAIDDNVVDTSPHPAFIHHSVSSTADSAHYPLSTIIPTLQVNITDNDLLLLNELKVNPPGPVDNPFEFVEIKGAAGALLTNVYLLVIEGNIESNPGTLNLAVNLSSTHLGSNGLLVVVATNNPYAIPSNTTVVTDPRLSAPGGGLGNGSISFLLVSSPSAFKDGKDLDAGNNGVLEGLPNGTTILDAVAWSDGDTNDVVYGGVVLAQNGPAPDAATRFPSNNVPQSAAAWFFGELDGTNGATSIYDVLNVSSNFPFGAVLTPGGANSTVIGISPLAPFSGVIGDPTNPGFTFTVTDSGPNANALVVTASSSNPFVVPDANLSVTTAGPGLRLLNVNPVGVGYATITITGSDGNAMGQITVQYAASAMGRPGGRFHTGASDASTAIAIDADWMFVGDDESQIIRLYRRNYSGPPVSVFDFQPLLGLTGQEAGEVDIEASTRVGNRLFWLGSQSNNNAAQARTNRSRVFATDVSGSGVNSILNYVGRYDHLREDLVNWDVSNLHGKGSNYYGFAASAADGVNPKAPDGFNIEGLSMAPGSSNVAWLGFRAPLVPPSERAAALILPLTNFDTVVISGGPVGSARFGAPIELNLRCRGIRSIESSTNGVLISAGSPGANKGISPNDFRLFTWTGNPADTPQERAADLTGLNPEGIVEVPPSPWTSNTLVQLISDNGTTDYYNDGLEAKHLPFPGFKKSRSDWVAFGGVVVSQPACTRLTITANTATLSWCSVSNLSYQIQCKTNLQDAVWAEVPGDTTAIGPLTTRTFPISSGPQRFFRLLVLVP